MLNSYSEKQQLLQTVFRNNKNYVNLLFGNIKIMGNGDSEE